MRVAFHLQDYLMPRVLQPQVQAADAGKERHRLHDGRCDDVRDGVSERLPFERNEEK